MCLGWKAEMKKEKKEKNGKEKFGRGSIHVHWPLPENSASLASAFNVQTSKNKRTKQKHFLLL